MNVLFLITGFLFAALVPFLNYAELGLKGTLYYLILEIFLIFVLAYAILSFFKAQIAKLEYIASKTIVGWNISEAEKKDTLPYMISLIIGIVFGIILLFSNVNIINAILLAIACSLTVLGWLLMGLKRLNDLKNSLPSFLLSHIGMRFKDKVHVFNGYSKGITSVKNNDGVLILSVLKNKKELQYSIEIPNDKLNEVDDFILDMNAFFNGVNNG